MPIEIVDYRSSWPAEFVAAAEPIRAALGDRALAIHHVGSTSVPGLCAKDIVDVQVTVGGLGTDLVDAMVGARFGFRRDLVDDHPPAGMTLAPADLAKYVFVERAGDRRTNIHVRVRGAFNQQYAVLFRDYVRAHPEARDAYCQLKRALAIRDRDDIDFYYDIKDPAIDMLMAGARIWADSTGWREPETDG